MKYRVTFLICPLLGKQFHEESVFEVLSDEKTIEESALLATKIVEGFHSVYNHAWIPKVQLERLVRIVQEEITKEVKLF